MTYNLSTDAYEEDKNRDDGAFDLVVNGEDISQYVGDTGGTNENRTRWTLHTTLRSNGQTSHLLQPRNGKKVSVRFRLKSRTRDGATTTFPWRSSEADLNWRRTEEGGGGIAPIR